MIKIILHRFWPIIIVILIYIISLIVIQKFRPNDPKYRKIQVIIRKYSITILFLALFSSILMWYLDKDGYTQGQYKPAYFKNGKLIPAQITQQ